VKGFRIKTGEELLHDLPKIIIVLAVVYGIGYIVEALLK
jgi:hypothetical protein